MKDNIFFRICQLSIKILTLKSILIILLKYQESRLILRQILLFQIIIILIILIYNFYLNKQISNSIQQIEEKQNKQIVFKNIKIDEVTLRVLINCINFEPIRLLTFQNNEINDNISNLICDLIKNNKKLIKLNFCWNATITASFYQNLQIDRLRSLCLKGNNLNSKNLKIILQKLQKKQPQQLKNLELFHNNIDQEGLSLLANYLHQNGVLQYLGLGKNHIKYTKQLVTIFQNLYQVMLTQNEQNDYKNLLKQKKNLQELMKKKKKPIKKLEQIKIPQDIVEINQKFYKISNPQMKYINLIDNQLTDLDFVQIHKKSNLFHKGLKIILALNSINPKIINQTFSSQIFIF